MAAMEIESSQLTIYEAMNQFTHLLQRTYSLKGANNGCTIAYS